MPVVQLGQIVTPARAAGQGAGAFNVIGIEHAEAIVAGAAAAKAPVVLQVSENCVKYHGGLAGIGRACLAVAAAAEVPVAVHLDHATSWELVAEAGGLGFGSVMFDASVLPYAENVEATREVVTWCHERGVWVEAEIGEIGGKDGAHHPTVRTKPGEAAGYAAATGVDALAVAVGSSTVHSPLVIERTYPASPERVFGAWSEQAGKAQWFGPSEKNAESYSLDFREGGREHLSVPTPDGAIYSFDAVVADIVPAQRIVHTYDMHRDDARISVSVATIEVEAVGGTTRLTLTEQGVFLDGLDSPAEREHGTKASLDALGTHLQNTEQR